MARRSTSTSAFGVSKREGHDASGFYGRFTPPVVSAEAEVAANRAVDKLIVGDARRMDEVPECSVALVVTSPPYFAGKEYEQGLGEGGIPATYLEYLQMLRDVFAECARKLEPGGRIAVNVANLGRRPYRSLSADVIAILQDDLRLLLRGEIVWVKQRGSSGSCAWGSFQRPANPVLRDLTERVVVASKGRFDRAVPAKARARHGLPSEGSMTRDDFMEYTLDVWELPAESARRVKHPAPFPVELPSRLIQLYTYRGDLVLDPFAGSGTTAVAAVTTGRHYAGYDLDESYVRLAEARVDEARRHLDAETRIEVKVPAESSDAPGDPVAAGYAAKELARDLLVTAGFADVRENQRQPGGVKVTFTALDGRRRTWQFEVAGGFTTHRPGVKRSEHLWRVIAKAAVLQSAGASRFVLLTAGDASGIEPLAAVTGDCKPIRTVVDLTSPSAVETLRSMRTEP
ncbi:MAG TPA: site-specific DNA-methyltransferase [Acidimicrobiales bacterium]|nr:site-specific DNA-methyltransferase [Acidimicrobiales bacterium]